MAVRIRRTLGPGPFRPEDVGHWPAALPMAVYIRSRVHLDSRAGGHRNTAEAWVPCCISGSSPRAHLGSALQDCPLPWYTVVRWPRSAGVMGLQIWVLGALNAADSGRRWPHQSEEF